MHFSPFIVAVALTSLPVISLAGKCDAVLATDRLVQCLGEEHSEADAQLNATYNQLRAKLDQDGKGLLKQAQVAWLSYRDRDCEFQASAVAGGQAYQPTYITCQTEKTTQRIGELKRSGR